MYKHIIDHIPGRSNEILPEALPGTYDILNGGIIHPWLIRYYLVLFLVIATYQAAGDFSPADLLDKQS
ncbi:MAG: hypothetical protein J2P31_04415 [Blastocatellia bacterium]|nr:hypothetical protein [Blastocatellia bacterium]